MIVSIFHRCWRPGYGILGPEIFIRSMGGGSRTYPGGINKWQWRRLQQRTAKEKEKRLLNREKQLYRAQIFKPNGPRNAVADRFLKPGAEDLWNVDDGPLRSAATRSSESLTSLGKNPSPLSIHAPVGVRKLLTMGGGHNYTTAREIHYLGRRGFENRTESKFEQKAWKCVRTDNLSRKYGNDFDFVSGAKQCAKMKDVKRVVNLRKLKNVNDHENNIGFSACKHRQFAANVSSSDDDDDEVELMKHDLKKKKDVNGAMENDKLGEETIFSKKRFDEFGLSPLTMKALSLAGYVQMTKVQEVTIASCLDGRDSLVRAKSGTGKTASFVLPAIETVLKATSSNSNPRISPVYVLILCPTRELASQISAEANAMMKYHDGSIGAQTLVGGTRFKDDQKRLELVPCQIVVATPGRLLDHIENRGGLSARLMGLKMLVVDEADHLLDLGFQKDIEKIVDCLPRQRQSLMFSTTIPREVRRMSQLVLKRDHALLDTIRLGCVETPVNVKQSFLVVPLELHFETLYHLLLEHTMKKPNYKVIIFCITGMMTSLSYSLLRELKMNVREIHARKPQVYRDRISAEFRKSKQLILVSSDVSSHGLNYPDVSLVIQVGIPIDRVQYIHRLGRTGRRGNEGECVLLLAPWEEHFLNELKDLPLVPIPSLPGCSEIKQKIVDSMKKIDTNVKEAAYHTWLGYYNSIREIGRDKTALVEMAGHFCQSIGLQKCPPLLGKTALKMGLKGIHRILVQN